VTTSGVYTMRIGGRNHKLYCDQTTDGGGWTAIISPTNHSLAYASQLSVGQIKTTVSSSWVAVDGPSTSDDYAKFGHASSSDWSNGCPATLVLPAIRFNEIRLTVSFAYLANAYGQLAVLDANNTHYLFWMRDDQCCNPAASPWIGVYSQPNPGSSTFASHSVTCHGSSSCGAAVPRLLTTSWTKELVGLRLAGLTKDAAWDPNLPEIHSILVR